MALHSLRAKGVTPRQSMRADLPGWQLRFNVGHFFRHEGGVGNIEACAVEGDEPQQVQGVLHRCEDATDLALLDAAEAYGHGYDRIDVTVQTAQGEVTALTYVGLPAFIDNACLPTRRYLNILITGAEAAGLDAGYIESLRRWPVMTQAPAPAFVAPPGSKRLYTAATLSTQPPLTALDGQVFDMSAARERHRFLQGFFGGRDMTLFHLQRMDRSDGSETEEDVRLQRYSPQQRACLDAYLQAYLLEYRHVGHYRPDAEVPEPAPPFQPSSAGDRSHE
jgi:sulfite reductase (NADPH) flavoprotein alpha-component